MNMEASKRAVDVGMAQHLLQLKLSNDNVSHCLQASDPWPRPEDDAESCTMTDQPSVSRWNPTADQVTILKELYRGGMRTPTAEQIQQISSKLRVYGKIEGKNVFYWFQNHKARERQKRRRCALIGMHLERPLPDSELCWITEEDTSSPVPIAHSWGADLHNKAMKVEHQHIVDHHRNALEMGTVHAYGDCITGWQGFSKELCHYNYPHHIEDGCRRKCEQNLQTLQLFPMQHEEDLIKPEREYCTPLSLYGGLKDGRSLTAKKKDPLDLSLNSLYGN